MVARFNLFTLVHKGLRHALQEIVWSAGRLDMTDSAEREAFFDKFRQVVLMLHQHANDEDTFIQPLIEQCSPEIGQELESQHQRSDSYLKELEEDVEVLAGIPAGSSALIQAWPSFLAKLNRFVGDYYLHLYHEESVAMPLMWEAYNDEELMAVGMKVRSNVPAHIQADFQRYMIPALNIQEQTMMLLSVKQAAPEPVFQELCRLFETLLRPEGWSRVRARLLSAESV